MAAAQLSLFAEPDRAADAQPRRRRAGQASAPRPPATAADDMGLFDVLLAESAATSGLTEPMANVPASSEVSEVLSPVGEPTVDADPTESEPSEVDDSSGRIPFDPSVWQLRSESGDFINIRTGEVRAEDEFQFASAAFDSIDDPLDEWDVAQIGDE